MSCDRRGRVSRLRRTRSRGQPWLSRGLQVRAHLTRPHHQATSPQQVVQRVSPAERDCDGARVEDADGRSSAAGTVRSWLLVPGCAGIGGRLLIAVSQDIRTKVRFIRAPRRTSRSQRHGVPADTRCERRERDPAIIGAGATLRREAIGDPGDPSEPCSLEASWVQLRSTGSSRPNRPRTRCQCNSAASGAYTGVSGTAKPCRAPSKTSSV
jgi:hypothetical protein